MPRHLKSEDFIIEFEKLDPPWGANRPALAQYLEAFDESGLLKPIYRVVLTPDFARQEAVREGIGSVHPTGEVPDVIEKLCARLPGLGTDFGDPEARTVLEDCPEEFQRYVQPASADERIDWARWKVEVARLDDGTPLERPFAFSYYGSYQRLRLWTLLECYSFRALLNPRNIHPKDVISGSWDRNLHRKIMTWSTGCPRLLGTVDQLEKDNWLATLYQVEEVISWGRKRVIMPNLYGWAEGETLSEDERGTQETNRVRERTRALGARWLGDRDSFVKSVHLLMELRLLASDLSAGKLVEVLDSDLFAAAFWAAHLYDCTSLSGVSDLVGPDRRGKTLAHVLAPVRRNARDLAEQWLPKVVNSFNVEIRAVQLDATDILKFLEFLEDIELDSWYVELHALESEVGKPSDAYWERRFLHMRSLAILFEPILVALADKVGIAEDREKMKLGTVKGPLKAFFADRPDWRSEVWGDVHKNWSLTRTTTYSFMDQLDATVSAAMGGPYPEVTRTILTFALVRNYGSHRFTRDPQILSKYTKQILRALIWTPLLYWKVATTLG